MPYLFVPGFNVVRELQHAFLLLWYLLIKVCQEPDLKVWLPPLSHKYELYLLIPSWTILWEKQQLWTLSQKHEETLYFLPLVTAVYSEAVLSSPSLNLTTDCWADAGWGWGEEGKVFPQTGSQMSLYLLNNQVVFYNIQVNTSLQSCGWEVFLFCCSRINLYLD